MQFRGSGFATVSPKTGSVVHGLLWTLTPKSEQALDRYEGYPRHYTKEQVSVRTTDDAAVSVMAYIMAEPMSRQPALPSPYYYRAIQQGFEANGLPVESLEEAWNRTIDEIWLGKVERPKNGKNPKTRSSYLDYPDLLLQRMGIAHGVKRSTTISPIINGNHTLGLHGHIPVSPHKA